MAYWHSVNGALLVGIGERLGEKDAQDMAPLGPLRVAGEKDGAVAGQKVKEGERDGAVVGRERKRWEKMGPLRAPVFA